MLVVPVAGPFTVESFSPHLVVPADEDELLGAAPQPGMPAPMPDGSASADQRETDAGADHQASRNAIAEPPARHEEWP